MIVPDSIVCKPECELKWNKQTLTLDDVACSTGQVLSAGQIVMFMAQNLMQKISKLNGRYNKCVYWPQELDILLMATMSHRYVLQLSRHAEYKANQLGINPGVYKALLCGDIVEVEVCNGVIHKIIVRLLNKFNSKEHICGAIAFQADDVAFVKTLWLNNVDDMHSTIHVENYVCG